MEIKTEEIGRPPEKEIYEKLWAMEGYRKYSPGENAVSTFLSQAKPPLGAGVIDFGCGSGRAGLLLAFPPPAGANMDVTLLDFTSNCLDEDIPPILEAQSHTLRFVQADLTVPHLSVSAAYGFCVDVLEHIPENKIDTVINNCLMSAQHCFFQICIVPDSFGSTVGHDLHLTVKPFSWWLEKFQQRECVIHWSKENGPWVYFYVTAWVGAQSVSDIGMLNVGEETIKKYVTENITKGFMQVSPHETNDIELMVLGGGPTLNSFVEEIKEKREQGVKLITLNGSYNWAIEHGLTPSATVICDAREFDNRFVKPVVDGCKYLMCSQVHPSVLEGLPKDRTYLWHTSAEVLFEILKANYQVCYPIPGGSTVLLRAIPLLRMLGFTKFHLYGCDSCMLGDSHHAYEQKENDGVTILPLSVTGGRVFQCTAAQASQAQEFITMIQLLGDEIQLEVYGDGLLAHILKVGASLDDVKSGDDFTLS